MRLLAHRGLWSKNASEKNSWHSLVQALREGHGIETDLRDLNGSIVVAHDLPRFEDPSLYNIENFLEFYSKNGFQSTLALNIKADGLASSLQALIQKYAIENYFVFDMSIPDGLQYRKSGMNCAVRVSEYEPIEMVTHYVRWIWLDSFHGIWFSEDLIRKWLLQGKKIAIVSCELHKRDNTQLWTLLKKLDSIEGIYLCTDDIEEAVRCFHVEKN